MRIDKTGIIPRRLGIDEWRKLLQRGAQVQRVIGHFLGLNRVFVAVAILGVVARFVDRARDAVLGFAYHFKVERDGGRLLGERFQLDFGLQLARILRQVVERQRDAGVEDVGRGLSLGNLLDEHVTLFHWRLGGAVRMVTEVEGFRAYLGGVRTLRSAGAFLLGERLDRGGRAGRRRVQILVGGRRGWITRRQQVLL